MSRENTHFSELSDSELERLALLVEEAAEVQQIAMKIVRHGYSSCNPFDDDQVINRRLLEKEVAHLQFAIRLMIDYHDLNEPSIKRFEKEKRGKINQYLHHNFANEE